MRQVAAALDAAHEQGLVHRDVKPGNVLLARQRGSEAGEHVYLSDFGLTKRSASDSGITGTGQFVGTLDYAAPEQFKGGTPDARTDVYSLGCVLFECLTGRPPFVSENDAGLMYAHLQQPPPSATAEKHELPAAIDGVLATAMAKAPPDRYPAAGALADEASRALGVGGDAGAGSPERTRLRRMIPAIAVAVALLAGVALASVFRGDSPPSWEGLRPRRARSRAPNRSPSSERSIARCRQTRSGSWPPYPGSQRRIASRSIARSLCKRSWRRSYARAAVWRCSTSCSRPGMRWTRRSS